MLKKCWGWVKNNYRELFGLFIRLLIFGFIVKFAINSINLSNELNEYNSECYYDEVIEKIELATPPSEFNSLAGSYFVFKGEIEQAIYYKFYLIDDKGRKLLRKENAEEVFIVDDYVGEPYIELVWEVRKHGDEVIRYDKSISRSQSEKQSAYSSYSKYTGLGYLKTVTIYTPKVAVGQFTRGE